MKTNKGKIILILVMVPVIFISGVLVMKYTLQFPVVTITIPEQKEKEAVSVPVPIAEVSLLQEVVDEEKFDPAQATSTDTAFEGAAPRYVLLDVPFTVQAPFGGWADARQDYGCEEASILMAMHWVRGEELSPAQAEKEIIAISEFENEQYGDFHDTSAEDTLKVMKAYFKYENAFVKFDIGTQDIKDELAQGNVVIVPIDGRQVGNPYYTPPGPPKHKLVIRGYDDATQEFITNDPGTKRGEGYRYKYDVLEAALLDYPTGINEPITEIRTAMIVVQKM
ncbi:MAG: C39 family peptidase [Candidatus Azambacteria bacterium]|nr:C39 family peptidase [Candidatus Azambacteria bacterium]